MAELADALDSGSSEQYAHAGSSPVSRTNQKALKTLSFRGFFLVYRPLLPFILPFTALYTL